MNSPNAQLVIQARQDLQRMATEPATWKGPPPIFNSFALDPLNWDPLQIMFEELQFAKALGVRLNGWRLGSRALIKLHEHYNCPAASLDMSGNFSSILGLEVFFAEDPWTVSGVYDD